MKSTRPSTENDRGNGPATPGSPGKPANHRQEPIEFKTPPQASNGLPFEQVDEEDAAQAEIEAMFRWKLISLRRLPRYQRAAALRAAREWRLLALLTLREKRARDRRAQYVHWCQQMPPLRPSA